MKFVQGGLCLLAALALVCGAGIAEEEGERAQINGPAEFDYDVVFKDTDGSEEVVFGLMDTTNDETTIVDSEGPLEIEMNMYAEDGSCWQITAILINTELGRCIAMSDSNSPGTYVYSFADVMAYQFGENCFAGAQEQVSPEQFEQDWSTMYYPYAANETLYGIGQEEDETTHFRTRGLDLLSGAEGEFEYELTDGMRLRRTIAYIPGADGELYKSADIYYRSNPEYALPDVVLERAASYLSKQ